MDNAIYNREVKIFLGYKNRNYEFNDREKYTF